MVDEVCISSGVRMNQAPQSLTDTYARMAAVDTQSLGLTYYAEKLSHEHAVDLHRESPAPKDANLRHLPPRYTGERVWVGADMAMKRNQWIISMSEDDRHQLLKALHHFKGSQSRSHSEHMLIIDRSEP